MTATPVRPVQRHTAPPTRAQDAPLLSAEQSGTGLLLGLLGTVGAFAAVPLALSQPMVGVVLLLLGLALLVVLMLRRVHQPDPAEDDLWAGIPITGARRAAPSDDVVNDLR